MGFVKGNWLLRCRASELFDWLRSLPENHELAHLCDVYTYTTIISQCGSHQQLRKALELVAEMRSHGVVCNVHTYSALMNVCIKVGPWSPNARFGHRKINGSPFLRCWLSAHAKNIIVILQTRLLACYCAKSIPWARNRSQ